uniref:Cyclodipeptide synthase n=1 Tax=Candidatus Kentrum sp. FW TaxID=2126338 RepID=A0A450U382_9GAMM|nr:MAG: cyclo(L-tyrosyl-L-tyrosyl) synthase [Candidatus Kentron sp. FW]
MELSYVSASCRRPFESGESVILGISPFNSYFSRHMISRLYGWGKEHFAKVSIYVPDKPSAYTLMAMGYEEKKANKKAKRQSNYLFNKIHEAIGSDLDIVTLVNSDWLENCPIYWEKLDFLRELFDTNRRFREGCLATSRWVMENCANRDDIDQYAVLTAVEYFLSELPLFIFGANILKTDHSVFAYHGCPEFLSKLFRDKLFGLVDGRHGYAIVQPETP